MKKKQFHILLLSIIVVLSSCSGSTKTAVEKLSVLKVTGNVFTNEAGETIRLQGVSFSDPDKLERDNNWNLRYFEEAKNWGCNIVRFPVHTYTWRYRGADEYLKLLDQGVEWAAQTGMYVIIDWHAIGNLPQNKYPHFNYETNWKEIVKFWQTIAEHYKGNSTVAFYELFNEPTDQEAPLTWEMWRPMMEELIDEVNKIDDQKIYVVAGMDWAYLLDEVIENPVSRPNVAYVTHPYPQKREQPWEAQWENDFGKVADVYPIVATEFGYVVEGQRGQHIPVVGDETYGNAIINYFDKKGISYTVWCFDPDWSPALLDDYNFTPSPRQGVFFKNVLQRNSLN
ncbi:MAG: glycoside hydrolase family 5 protein [Candidatus Symbiothrix sp.]|jgi:aryl-phospho-beta-D-glucosidase BglC (GH1 family)|nr:glycoside hydrolase family 5 protein [Candidatus Symbiothrix sp.]